MSIPDSGPGGDTDRLAILAMIRAATKYRASLPDYDDIRRRYQHGTGYQAGTTGEYLLSWLAERGRAEDISRNTIRGYESHIRRVFLPAFGDVPLDKLRASHFTAAMDLVDQENTRILAAREDDDPAVRKTVAGAAASWPGHQAEDAGYPPVGAVRCVEFRQSADRSQRRPVGPDESRAEAPAASRDSRASGRF